MCSDGSEKYSPEEVKRCSSRVCFLSVRPASRGTSHMNCSGLHRSCVLAGNEERDGERDYQRESVKRWFSTCVQPRRISLCDFWLQDPEFQVMWQKMLNRHNLISQFTLTFSADVFWKVFWRLILPFPGFACLTSLDITIIFSIWDNNVKTFSE